ncbi:MAG: terminase family protein [Elusimicrobiota bacterium]|jgi:phage terminase large subunit-like protein|nr:terminase family protein [Elusimicrobiota bacterium]
MSRKTVKEMGLRGIDPIRFEEFVEENDIKIRYLSDKQLRMLCSFKLELEERERRFGVLYYRPQEYQKDFHVSNKKIRLVLGGNQTGKTEVGVVEDLRVALQIDPYNKFVQWGNAGGIRLRVVAIDLAKGIGEVIMPKMQKLAPMSEVRRIDKYSQGYWRKIEFKNGSTIEFMSYEQNDDTFEGWTGHFVHFDEPPPRAKYVATMRGLMRWEGRVIITATPLNEPWVYDEIYLRGLQGDDEIDVFGFSLYDNAYLNDKARESFIKTIPEDEREARVYGKFKHLTGLVYKEFGQEHLIDSFEVPSNWTRICAMDYHSRKSCAIVWVAIDEHNKAYVYDELETQGTIREIAEKIAAKEQESKGKIRYRFIDNLSATPDRVSGTSPQREFVKIGNEIKHPLLFRNSTKNWIMGKNAISDFLSIVDGKPNLYFFKDKCPILIKCMTMYTWAVANTKEAQQEKPRKLYDDFPDALRYALVLKPKYYSEERAQQIEYEMRNTEYGVTGYNLGQN